MSNHRPNEALPQLSAGDAAAKIRRLLQRTEHQTTRRRLEALLAAVEAVAPDADTLDYVAVRFATVGDGPSAADSFRTFRSNFSEASNQLGTPMTLEVDGNKKQGAEGRRCWFTGQSQRGIELSNTSAALTRSVDEESLVSADALPQDAVEDVARTAEKEVTVWIHLEHDPNTTATAEKLEELLEPWLSMHDQLAKLGIGVRISNSHLLAGQSSKQLNDRRQQAVVIVPLLTPKWVADHRETHWPAAAQLVPVCVTAMRTKIENGKILLADNAPMQVFQGGKPWPNRAGGNETFTEELADQLVARVKESYQQLQRQGMARRVELDDVTTVDHEAVQIGLTDASSRSLGNATPRHDRTEAVHVVDHLEAWAAASEGKPYAVLLGDSGSGKTTAAQVLNNRLNATYRKHLEHQGADRADARLSIYLDLRKADLDERQSPELERLINNVMERTWEEEAARTITPDVILDQVRNHGAVLIFDGLDEVLVRVNEQRGMEFIQQLWRALPPEMVKDDDRNTGRLVMTCRTHYFPTLDSERSFFGGQDRTDGVPTMYEALHLLPFNEAQIRDYLSQHFRKRDEHQPGLGQVDAAMTMLADVHNLLELAGRPYNLRLISQQLGNLESIRASGATVSLATLYDGFVRDWLSRDDTKHVLRPDDKRTLMEDLAGKLWRDSTRSMSHKDLSNWLMTQLSENTDLGRWFAVERPQFELAVEDLRTATFLVRPGAERFEFAHTSLLEFFLASYLVRALIDGRPESWAMPVPSDETLEFVANLLTSLRGESDRAVQADSAKSTLRELGDTYRRQASELAFRYCVKTQGTDAITRPLAGFNLAGATLRHLELRSEPDQPLLNLSGCNLAGADLRDARLHRVRLDDASFTGTRVNRAELHGCSLLRADFDQADLIATTFRDCRLTEINLAAATVHRTKVLQCDASGAALGPQRLGDVFVTPASAANQTDSTELASSSPSVVGLFPAGHCETVTGVACSAEAGRVITGSADSTGRVWDGTTGEALHTLTDHSSEILDVACSSDGSRVVTGSRDGTARIWDGTTGEVLHTLTGHTDSVGGVACSADGSRVITGSHDNTARIWDGTTGEVLHTLTGHTDSVGGVACSSDGSRVVTGSRDNTARIWDGTTGEVLHTLTGHTDSVVGVACSSDGSRVVTGSRDNTARIWDGTTGEVLHTLTGHTDWVVGVACSSNGDRVVTGSRDDTALIWDGTTGEVLHTLTRHGGWVGGVACSFNGERVVTGSRDGTARVWNAATGEVIYALTGRREPVEGVASSSNGDRVVTGSRDGTARVWNGTTGEVLHTLTGHTDWIVAVACSSNGDRVVTGSDDGTARVWNAATGEVLHTLTGHTDWVVGVACSSNGDRVATVSGDGVTRIWHGTTGAVLHTLTGQVGWVEAVACSSDGGRVVTGSDDGTTCIWDGTTGEVLHALTSHTDSVLGVACSADGSRVIIASADNTARIWDGTTGEVLHTLTGHTDSVLGVACSADGSRVITASADNTARIWDGTTGEVLHTLTGHTDSVLGVACSADGSRVITASADNTARIWDGTTGAVGLQLHCLDARSAATVAGSGQLVWADGEAWRHLGVLVTSPDGELLRVPAEVYGPLPGIGPGPFAKAATS